MSDKLRLRLRPIPKGNIIAQAADEIRRLVRGNRLPEGARLPSEHELCERLHISRSSVREALRVLEAVGLVEKIQGKGVFVRKQRPPSISERYPPKAMQEAGPIVLLMRKMLEPKCAELAAVRAGRREIEALEAELASLREALSLDDAEGAVEADSRFHLALARGSRNDVLVDLLLSLNAAATENRRRAMAFYNDGRLFRLHERILQAVRRRDPKAARASVEDHMRAIQNVETVLAKGGLDG
jgi:GntR family transcriptional repressor for pyruvate dehydrogenase complex